MNRKGEVYSMVLALMLALVLCGCGVKEKSEKEVIADLQASRWFISENLEIKSYEITKRQTDVEDKKDVVYLTVHTNEPEMTCNLSYVMEYVLYNDGWVLEAVRKDEEGEWSIQGLSQERLTKDIAAKDDFYNTWSLNIKSCNIENEVYIYNDGEYEKRYTVRITAEHTLQFCYEAEYMLSYRITENGWESGAFRLNSRDYWPIASLDEFATEKFVKGLTMEYGATTISYDGYKYLDTVTDWENRSETHRYLAWKDWFYGRETYLISVPLSFSLKDVPTWTYKKSEIDIKLHSMEWNIAGTWRNKYEPAAGNGYMTVKLSVDNITGTEDPEVYYASVSCDATSERWKSYRCQTNGTVKARIKYVEQGEWFLYVDDSDGGWDSFTIRGYSAGVNDQGFFWHYSQTAINGYCELKK